MNRKGFKDLEDAAKKKQATAYQLGVSSEELDNYAEFLPALWQILQLAKYTQGKGYDRSLYDAVRKAMQRGADPSRIKSILDEEKRELFKIRIYLKIFHQQMKRFFILDKFI